MIAISADNSSLARDLQQLTGLPLLSEIESASYLLHAGSERIEIRSLQEPSTAPLYVDFVEGENRHRRLYGGGRGQAIARAVGLKKLRKPRIADLTAGLGRDAFVLASLGCDVTLVERSPVIHLLLQDGLHRALQSDDDAVREIVSRMHLVHADSLQWLDSQEESFDVILLDPMFPERRKSALVRKEMRFFHDLVGSDSDTAGLLELARSRCKHRVVVKRPARATFLGGHKPSFSITGKSTRFDIYLAAMQQPVER
ncbi:MAG: class I SAM-dependent methyltransferase [Sedimenticolaceae bacterium]|nr:class I SAM-dependent methyltransferase [Sedimenticolaceae bacterium]